MSTKRLGNPSSVNPYISPKYTAADWKALDLSTESSPDWSKAVDIYLDRIRGRFLAPIQAIINHTDSEIHEFCGFTVISIDCLLIETMNQFHKGKDRTTERHHWEAFRDFFLGSEYFQSEFDTDKKVEVFYDHFRNGILHQAQTKKLSIIRTCMANMVQVVNPRNINQGLIIDRTRFHDALVSDINEYAEKIRHPSSQNDIYLRNNFVIKMNLITSRKSL